MFFRVYTLKARFKDAACHSEFIKASAVLAFFLMIFFARPIFLGSIPSPADLLSYWPMFHVEGLKIQNVMLSDVVTQFEPYYMFNYDSLIHLQLPLWNPYCAGGVPHLANMQSMIFLALTWPIYFLGFSGISLLAVYSLKLFLTGIFTYYYLRSIKLGVHSSLAGAIGFMFVGFNVMWLYYEISNVVWTLPASLFLVEKAIDKSSSMKCFLGIAAIDMLGIFAGNPETFLYIIPLSFLYLVYRLWHRDLKAREKIGVIKDYILFSFLGVGLSAVELAPFVEYLLNSSNWVSRNSNYIRFLDWHSIILNFNPDFFGTPSAYLPVPYYVNFSGLTNYNESTTAYVGISLLCLAVFTVLIKCRERVVAFYSLLAVWAMGVIYKFPLVFSITTSIPLLSQAQNTRLLFILGFCIVVLGSIGLDEILGRRPKEGDDRLLRRFSFSCVVIISTLFLLTYANRQIPYITLSNIGVIYYVQYALVIITCSLILLTFIAIYVMIRHADKPRLRAAALIGLLLLIFAETGLHGMLFTPSIQEKYFYQWDDPFERINKNGELYRATSIDPVNHMSVYPANVQMIYGVYDIRNYDSIEVRYSRELLKNCTKGRITGWIDFDAVNKNFLDFMGVKWVYSGADLSRSLNINVTGAGTNGANTTGEYCDNDTGFRLVEKYKNYYLLENDDALPRAFMAYNATFTRNDSMIMDKLADPGTDWVSPLLVYGEDKIVSYPPGNSNVTIPEYQPMYVKILANTSTPGFLVLTDTYYPGWNAYINGKKADVLRVDYAFRSVRLDAGKSIVEFKYEPMSFYAGVFVSAISLLLLLAIAASRHLSYVSKNKRQR